MSHAKDLVLRYLEAYRASDRDAVVACLTEDVEWDIPGHRLLRGRDAFRDEIVPPGAAERPDITDEMVVEEGDTVVVAGTVRTAFTDGRPLVVRFCDVFVLRDGLIARLVSYGVPVPEEAG